MNTPDRLELEQIKLRQRRLQEDLLLLDDRIKNLEGRVAAPAQRIEPAQPPPLPPVIPSAWPLSEPALQQEENEFEPAAPVFNEPQSNQEAAPAVPMAALSNQAGTVAAAVADVPVPPPQPAAALPKRGSFEMELGTYWFVRVGVVLLLTAMAFLGTYAYQNFVVKASPGVKVALMYFGGALLLGAGGWLQRARPDRKESLRQYGQVLFGGGLAAVYFTTYAAHHFEPLRVIASPVVDGVLLLIWAAITVWIADRRKSELLAVFGLGLAYYTSMITRVGWFTLYSNVILTAACVYFLWRNRWTILGFISLPASYLAYAFWRFYATDQWRLPGVEEHLATSAGFLGAYWVIFTVAVFITRQNEFKGPQRAAFLSFNNGAALGLFLLTMAQVRSGGLWKVLLGFGVVLLFLAFLARRFLREDTAAEQSYLTQGMALVTAGLIAKFSGMDLSLMLAVQSFVSLALGIRIGRKILRIGAYMFAAMAVGWLLDGLDWTRPALWRGIGVCIGLLGNTVLVHNQKKDLARFLREHVSYFVVLLLVCIGALLWHQTERAQMPVLGLLLTLALTGSIYVLKIRELPLLTTALFIFAQLAWLGNALSRPGPWEPLWQPVTLVAGTLALLHWWQHEKVLPLNRDLARTLQGIVSFFLVLLVVTWITPHVTPSFARPLILATLCGVVLVLTAYAAATRVGMLALSAQVLLVPAMILTLDHIANQRKPWAWALALPATLLILITAARTWTSRNPIESPRAQRALKMVFTAYLWGAALFVVFCVASYPPAQDRPWIYAALSLAAFAIAAIKGREDWLPIAGVFIACGLANYALGMRDNVWAHWPNLLLPLALFAQQRAARRVPSRYALPEQVHAAAILLGGACLWLLLSRYVASNVSGFLITVSWSALALVCFAAGILLRERVYRWLGLIVLGGALGRVIIFDVWKLNTIYRILSFLALGVALVLLGYFYNRYQEKIKELL